MTKLVAVVGMSVGGLVGWEIGGLVSFFTAFILSVVGTGVGLYLVRRYVDPLLP
jgi:hypothetical protein